MRPTRREVVWLVVSWLAWAFVAIHVKGPWDTILEGGDHWSHFGYSELFLRHGFAVFDNSPKKFCTGVLPQRKAAFAKDADCWNLFLCDMPDAPASRPLCINWQELGPAAYPLGLVLLSIPQALLYEHTPLSFRTINVLTILQYLAFAHLLFWVLWRVVFPAPARDDMLGGVRWELTNPWLRVTLFGLVYLEVIKQTLNGFYDPLAIFAVLLGAYFLAKRRSLDALVALSAALFLHYRALWYAPLLAYAALQTVRRKDWARPRSALKIAASVVMLGLFAYTFLALHPFLKNWPETNPILWKALTPWKLEAWSLLLPMAFLLLYLLWGGHWLLLLSIACQLCILVGFTRQVMPWHALFLLPMFGVARLDEERSAMLAALIFYVVEAAVVFNALPLPGELVSALAKNWGPWSL
ncbi:MAG TPA: hypothetical protein VMB50_20500 [Myxococcales bacterium]|nr:hypothetical protein [Myxococcales bacterium]